MISSKHVRCATIEQEQWNRYASTFSIGTVSIWIIPAQMHRHRCFLHWTRQMPATIYHRLLWPLPRKFSLSLWSIAVFCQRNRWTIIFPFHSMIVGPRLLQIQQTIQICQLATASIKVTSKMIVKQTTCDAYRRWVSMCHWIKFMSTTQIVGSTTTAVIRCR